MYERNAIVFERYFDKLFDYSAESNLKVNYKNYIDLVYSLEKYLESTDAEDKIMLEYEEIANAIKNIQKEQTVLYNKNIKLQNERNNLFSEVGENSEEILKKLTNLEKEIEENENALKNIGIKFIEEIKEFNEKIEIRTNYEKENRIIDITYKKSLDNAIDSFGKLNMDKVKFAKTFFEQDTLDIAKEIKEKVLKNGEKERVKFDENVINKAIQVDLDINKREIECYNDIFDKMGKLFAEIKDDNIKIEKHKKSIRDVKAKIDFLNAEKDYVILFLDNERLNVMSGEKEHHKLMQEACKDLESDLKQIENLYELLLKEISGKSTKKAFKELYNSEYLYDLDNKQKEFELKISKYNLIGTVINPDYWRIDGVRKIYDVFKSIMNETFDRDLSEYEYKLIDTVKANDDVKTTDIENSTMNVSEIENQKEELHENFEIEEETKKDDEENEEEIRRKKLDKILAFINNDSDSIEYDDEIETSNKNNVKKKQENTKKNQIETINEKKVESAKIDNAMHNSATIKDDMADDFEDESDIDFDDDFEDEKIFDENFEDDFEEEKIFDDDFDDDFDDEKIFDDDFEEEKIFDEDFDEDFDDTDEIDEKILDYNKSTDKEDNNNFDEDDFEDDLDVDFDEEEVEEENVVDQIMEVEKDSKKSKNKKEKAKKSTKKTKDKEKAQAKSKTKSTSKQFVDKIKKMAQTDKDIKNMWAE